jgi:hypothetical protein
MKELTMEIIMGILSDESCADDSKVALKVLRNYEKLKKELNSLGKLDVTINNKSTLSDFHSVYGARFYKNNIPTIKLTGKSEDKTPPVYIEDKLEPIQKVYWFGISMGLAYSWVENYKYITTTDQQTLQPKLSEVKFSDTKVAPALFFSVYPSGHRIDKKPRLPGTFSLNIGIDYTKPLDNVYLGLGLEPIRHLQLNFGIKTARVKRLNMNIYDPFQFEYETYLKDQWNWSPFVGVNFYLNAVPTLIQSIFTLKAI